MKIQSIQTYEKYNKQSRLNNLSGRNLTFNARINGHYYEDHIVQKAKKALKNPYWESDMLKKIKSVGKSLKTWHGEETELRAYLAIYTFGVSEVVGGAMGVHSDQNNNKEILKEIDEIKRCMKDLLEDPNGG